MQPFMTTHDAVRYFDGLVASGMEVGPVVYLLRSGKWWMYVRGSQWN